MIKSWFPVWRNLFMVSSTLNEYERYQIDCFSRRSTEHDVFLLLREFQHFMLYNFDSRFQNSLLWIIFGYWINILDTFWVNYYTMVIGWKTLKQFTFVIWTVYRVSSLFSYDSTAFYNMFGFSSISVHIVIIYSKCV